MASTDLAAAYAALILADDDVEITVRRRILERKADAAGRQAHHAPLGRQGRRRADLGDPPGEGVRWRRRWLRPDLCRLEGKDVKALLSNVGSGGGGRA